MTLHSALIDDIQSENLQSFAAALTELCQKHKIAIAGKIATYPLEDPVYMPDGDVQCLRYEVDQHGYIFN